MTDKSKLDEQLQRERDQILGKRSDIPNLDGDSLKDMNKEGWIEGLTATSGLMDLGPQSDPVGKSPIADMLSAGGIPTNVMSPEEEFTPVNHQVDKALVTILMSSLLDSLSNKELLERHNEYYAPMDTGSILFLDKKQFEGYDGYFGFIINFKRVYGQHLGVEDGSIEVFSEIIGSPEWCNVVDMLNLGTFFNARQRHDVDSMSGVFCYEKAVIVLELVYYNTMPTSENYADIAIPVEIKTIQ